MLFLVKPTAPRNLDPGRTHPDSVFFLSFRASWLHGLMVRSLPRPRCYMCRLRIDPSGTFAERPRLCACCEVLSAQKRQQAAFITLITWESSRLVFSFFSNISSIFFYSVAGEKEFQRQTFTKRNNLGPCFLGKLNHSQVADLTGKTAVVTGGRGWASGVR